MVWCVAFAAAKVFGAEISFCNPVVPGDHPDPSIIRVGKDYWATSTSSEWGPEFPLLHSTDLVNWRQTGSVFQQAPAWAWGNFWAPEISERNGQFFVYYTARQQSGSLAVAVAVADQPAGPYTDHGPMVAQPAGSIDPVPCTDENGKPYLIWKEDGNSINHPTPIWAQRLDDSGTKVIGEPKELIRNDVDWEGPLVEGPYVLRRGDWFYLFYSGNGCCGTDCNYAEGVARAHSLLGPWEKNPANPILSGNEVWKCPGHGSIVTDERGRYWLLYHAYPARGLGCTGREGMLDEVVFGTNGWPTINKGNGPSAKALSPLGAVQNSEQLSFYDDFSGDQLKPGWQWPQHVEPAHFFRNGRLVLSTGAAHGADAPIAVLARATTTADYIATAVIDVGELRGGAAAGLAAYGGVNDATGLSVSEGKLTLWQRDHWTTTRLAQADAPAGPKLFLRLTAKEGFQFHFAASADGEKWLPVENVSAEKAQGTRERTMRVALTVSGNEKAEGTFVSFRIEPVK